MPVEVHYVDRTPTTTTVLGIITEPNGVCQAVGELLPSGLRFGPTQSYEGCPTTPVVWQTRNVPTRLLEMGGARVLASTCTNDPDRGRAQSDCRAGRTPVVSGDGGPYPPAPVSSTPGPRCPGVAMGDCSSNSQCTFARESLQRLRDDMNTICERYRTLRRQADVYRALAVGFGIAAGVALGVFFAAAGVPPPFGPLIMYVAMALAILMMLAMAAALIAVAALEHMADQQRHYIDDDLEEYQRLLGDAESLCICQGCGVQAVDRRLPDACLGIPGLSLST